METEWEQKKQTETKKCKRNRKSNLKGAGN